MLKTPKTSHTLAIDFGSSKVGLAFSENETGIAFALPILKNDGELWGNLEKIIREKEIDHIILGSPRWKEENKRIEEFSREIEKRLGIVPTIVDEMFTTKMAKENLKEAGKKDLSQDDSEAARIMLEEWLS
ncbi:MAG: Holliday junction resolvase RuvX [Patescibacteria group bacterium]